MRDPTVLGALLLSQTPSARDAFGADITLSEAYDVHVRHLRIADYDGSNDIRPRVESGAAH